MKRLYLYLLVVLLSFSPVLEVRAGIPFGILSGLTAIESLFLAVIGGIFSSLFGLFIFRKILNMLNLEHIIDRLTLKHKDTVRYHINKYGYIGLMLFVAIPLPGSGVWTSSLCSDILDLNNRKSIVYITIGNIIASLIVIVTIKGVIKFI